MMRRAQPWLGTLVEISVPDDAPPESVNAAFAAVARVHGLMSFHDPASDVTRINRAQPGELVEVDAATCEVLRFSLRVADISGGAFDIACAPRLVQWGLLPEPVELVGVRPPTEKPGPDPNAAKLTRHPRGGGDPCRVSGTGKPGMGSRVRGNDGLAVSGPDSTGQDVLALEGAAVRKLAPGWIDLGGVAKGYAVDCAVAALQAAGVASGCVNAGGDLRVFGDGEWPVAVRAPHAPTRAAAEILLRAEALATSGSYFSVRRHGQRMVSALVDGRDGQPLTATCSASVRAPTCMAADALTKVVLASGEARHPALDAFAASAFII